jgi:hypothetical protein
MIHDHNLQSTHCRERPAWTGRWFSPKGDRWWQVWVCPEHLDALTGLREFGRHPVAAEADGVDAQLERSSARLPP